MTDHILDQIHAFLGRFIAYPNAHAHTAHTLWIAHTWTMDAWDSTPRIAFLSPEPGSGKTRALEITELLVPNAVEAVNVTPAYLFRKVGDNDEKPTILFDEIDTIFGPKAKDNEEIRGLLNAGHRKGAIAGRCVVKGRNVTTEEIPAYCAVALAGIGELPDTLLSRSIVIKMRRRAPDEHVEPYRRRIHGPPGKVLRAKLERWVGTIRDQLQDAWPDMPHGINDRDADVWEPLLAVADEAGGEWPDTARQAATALVQESQDFTPSLGVRLLADLYAIFNGHEHMSTEQLLDALHKIEEAPWNDLYGKALNPRGLAQRLRKYEISSKNIRTPMGVVKGYTRDELWDVWQRYLPHLTSSGVADVADVAGTPAGPPTTLEDLIDDPPSPF